jgi:hypothetical protein
LRICFVGKWRSQLSAKKWHDLEQHRGANPCWLTTTVSAILLTRKSWSNLNEQKFKVENVDKLNNLNEQQFEVENVTKLNKQVVETD